MFDDDDDDVSKEVTLETKAIYEKRVCMWPLLCSDSVWQYWNWKMHIK